MYYNVSSNPFYFKEFETTSDPLPPAFSVPQLHVTQAEKYWPITWLSLHLISKADASLLHAGRKRAGWDAGDT